MNLILYVIGLIILGLYHEKKWFGCTGVVQFRFKFGSNGAESIGMLTKNYRVNISCPNLCMKHTRNKCKVQVGTSKIVWHDCHGEEFVHTETHY